MRLISYLHWEVHLRSTMLPTPTYVPIMGPYYGISNTNDFLTPNGDVY